MTTAPGPFLPTWESLMQYRVPDWYQDAKFGIFIHWGVYAVPAFGNEWYPRNMYLPGSREYQHHLETYGPHTGFGYKDFIPQFKAERYDPAAWAKLFKAAGARYVVPVAEHHDGFAMYDTALSEWCAAKMGPRRDLIGELADAIRQEGMVFGVSSHRAEHWWFMNGGMTFASDVQDPRYRDFYGPAMPGPQYRTPEWRSLDWQPRPDARFLDDWLARLVELVDKYRPQLVWFDWWIEQIVFAPYLQKFAAHYYNRGVEWGLGTAINFKNEAFPPGTAVYDIERGQLSGAVRFLWQNDTSVSKNSWGYVRDQQYKAPGDLIQDLIDVVSKSGVLLLNVGPRPDGVIPEPEQEILLAIGRWLAINGEAIYATRPWRTFGEGPTPVPEGSFTDTERNPFTGRDFRFTAKGHTLYAIALAWPGEEAVIASLAQGAALCPERVAEVQMLGAPGALPYRREADGLHVQLPAQPPCDHAYVLKITLEP
ncbi:MAG: alpha-L-fucosidase [Chloroflexota bacterium]|nr:alpha-L-fucosidase [Chloroflexota bacterium]